MKIMSTDIRSKSTDGENRTSLGSNESIKHSDDNPHPMNAQRPPDYTMGKNDGKEWNGEVKEAGIERIQGGGSCNSDANHEAMCRHPERAYDPCYRAK